jgi:flagellar biosynthesis protein FlhB
MINKKQIIKRYLQEADRVPALEDETALKIAQIAARFNIPFFENKALRTRLLCCDTVYELSQNKRHEIVTLLKFFVNIQQEAQLSK